MQRCQRQLGRAAAQLRLTSPRPRRHHRCMYAQLTLPPHLPRKWPRIRKAWQMRRRKRLPCPRVPACTKYCPSLPTTSSRCMIRQPHPRQCRWYQSRRWLLKWHRCPVLWTSPCGQTHALPQQPALPAPAAPCTFMTWSGMWMCTRVHCAPQKQRQPDRATLSRTYTLRHLHLPPPSSPPRHLHFFPRRTSGAPSLLRVLQACASHRIQPRASCSPAQQV